MQRGWSISNLPKVGIDKDFIKNRYLLSEDLVGFSAIWRRDQYSESLCEARLTRPELPSCTALKTGAWRLYRRRAEMCNCWYCHVSCVIESSTGLY